ncbi:MULTISPECIES: hypothetical protein [unclassified Mesorhizobium]|uniref:hypothetical protein n=1 Tax=unclassified Mesorhizobium TaxID=325217 RepID=UPI001CD14F9A|nr:MULTISPECIES: hypothetical protein [unclassified Mesorhizobium]MBZ9962148.1 hypothetical protein [Mesorhizobium sp. BR1-1-14]
MAGLTGGLLIFMLSARFHPLGSPVLRTAPLGFTRAWLRLTRLPLQLSVAYFLLPAGAALAAEPSAWAMPLASGFWLLALNGAIAREWDARQLADASHAPGTFELNIMQVLWNP